MKFSIITIVKNGDKYLRETMESVLTQRGISTDFDLEYVIVYGESPDTTFSIIDAYKEKYPHLIKIIIDQDNAGIAHAMNVGIEAATGDILAHIHADDLYENDHIFLDVLRCFSRYPKTHWLFSSIRIIDEKGETLRIERKEYRYKTLKRHCLVPHPCVFMKKLVYDDIGLYNPDYKLAMDYELWRRVVGKYKPKSFPDQVFARFRVHSGSSTEAHQRKSEEELEKIKSIYNQSVFQKIIRILKKT